MTYTSLDTIPYKLFFRIADTGEVSLLSDIETDIDILVEIWNKIYDEHLSKNQSPESKRIFKISKEIDSLITLNKVVIMACECLRFEFDQDLYDMIIGFGYKLNITDTEAYYNDIKIIERESNAYIIKAEHYKNMLPEPKENKEKDSDYNVDDVMASYSAILGFSIGDFNLITYTAFYGYGKQVQAKIKSLKKD